MPTIVVEDTSSDPITDALSSYRLIAWSMHDAARKLEQIENLPPIYKAMAAALIKLSGLRPHQIRCEAGPSDAKCLIADLEAITCIVDPLVEAYGDVAKQNFHGIDIRHFQNVLRDSLEGFGLFDIEEAGRNKEDEIRSARGQRMTMERV